MSDLECAEFVELVTAFLDDALDAPTAQRLREHVELCEGCARYLDQVRQTSRSLGALPPDGVPDAVRAALLARFRSRS